MKAKKKPTGRPRKKLNKVQLDNLPHFASRCSHKHVADLYGIDEGVFRQMLKDDPTLNQMYKKAKAETALFVVNKLMGLIEKSNPAAIFFYLKCQLGWSENKGDVELITPTNQTVTVKVIGADGKKITPDKGVFGNGG